MKKISMRMAVGAAGVLAAAVLSACASETIVPEPVVREQLHPVDRRISDEAIEQDRGVIDNLRKRLRALNQSGRWPMDNYHVCKAQAWIDFAEVEYTDNDRGTVVESALNQARSLIDAMQSGRSPLPVDTPVIDESMVVRPDLWQFVAKTKQSQRAECLDCTLAKLEVQLIATGHDQKELGLRHAESDLLAAERLARAVKSEGQCPAMAGAVVIGPAVASAFGVRDGGGTPDDLRIPVVVHFAYDSALLSDETAVVLARAARVMRDYPQITVRLEGHADPRGDETYNRILGQRRANAVKDYFVAAGVGVDRISELSKGERESLQSSQATVRGMALDRRVELRFGNLPEVQVRTERPLTDVQADR